MTSIRKLRAASKNITKAMCETAFTERYKFYDAKCPGLLVAVSPTAPATFFVKCKSAGQRRTIRLGIYHPTDYTIETARIDANLLKSQGSRGIDVAKERRREKAHASKLSATVDQIIDERIEWMKTLVRKHDGEMRPRIESWEGVDRIFDRFVRPRLGKTDRLRRHRTPRRGTVGRHRQGQARQAVDQQCAPGARCPSGLFRWAAMPSRGYVNAVTLRQPGAVGSGAAAHPQALARRDQGAMGRRRPARRALGSRDLPRDQALLGHRLALDRTVAHPPRRAPSISTANSRASILLLAASKTAG